MEFHHSANQITQKFGQLSRFPVHNLTGLCLKMDKSLGNFREFAMLESSYLCKQHQRCTWFEGIPVYADVCWHLSNVKGSNV